MKRDSAPTIRLYIDKVVLDGLPVDRLQAPQVQCAIEEELTRLLAENGLAAELCAGRAVPHVRANGIHLETDSKPVQIGTQIAQSIFSGIGEER